MSRGLIEIGCYCLTKFVNSKGVGRLFFFLKTYIFHRIKNKNRHFLPQIRTFGSIIACNTTLHKLKTCFRDTENFSSLRKFRRWFVLQNSICKSGHDMALPRAKGCVAEHQTDNHGLFGMVFWWIKNKTYSLKNLKNTFWLCLFLKEL